MFLKPPHIVVVGAGIVGASLAYHLVRQRARVTLIDKANTSADGSTDKSFAWLTVSHGIPEAYRVLRQQGIADWHRVQEEFKGQLPIDWSGALTWYDDPAETERIARKRMQADEQIQLVDGSEVGRLEPNLKIVPPLALFAPKEGAIDPTLSTALFITAASQAGAVIQRGNEALFLMTNGSRVTGVVTSNGNLTADVVVLTAGIDVPSLCQPLNVVLPLNVSPALLMTYYTPCRFVNRIVSNSWMEIRATSATQILAAENYVDESIENNPQAIGLRVAETIKEHWRGTSPIKLVNVTTGKRPIPQDGLPIIGRVASVERLYIAVMHAGVTLAAVVGRLAAGELMSHQDNSQLSPYRPARFDEDK